MRLYFVNRFFYPDHSATSQMLSDLAFGLSARGYRITIVTSRLGYDDPTMRLPARETVRGVDIVRVATTGFGRSGLAGRAMDYATFVLAAAWALLWRLRRGDVVVTMTDPPLLSVLTTPIAVFRGASPANWLQDLFPEVATALGLARGRLSRLAMALALQLRDRALRNALLNVAISERMADAVRRRGVEADRVRVIHNWADGRLVKPVARQHNKLRRDWGLDGAFVVGYSGNLGRAHDVGTILAAIEEAAVEDVGAVAVAVGGVRRRTTVSTVNVSWLFVGGGSQFTKLKEKIASRGHCNVVFQPYQVRDRLSESLSVPDVHLISLRPELEGLVVPSKLYGIAAAGRPAIFIGDPAGEIGRILRETDTGIVVAEGDGPALARALRELAADPQRCEAMGRRSRALFEATYDLPLAAEAWDDAIRMLDRA